MAHLIDQNIGWQNRDCGKCAHLKQVTITRYKDVSICGQRTGKHIVVVRVRQNDWRDLGWFDKGGKRSIAKHQVVCSHLGLLQTHAELFTSQYFVKFE